MIPVTPQPEPNSFDKHVRQPGLAWLKKKNLDLNAPLPSGASPYPYWRSCLDDLHKSYAGVCAYLAIYIERATGSASVDHYVAKSADTRLTYEWSNYRLACQRMNSLKRAFDDVLDPFTLPANVFHLELVSGRIFVNPSINIKLANEAKLTIERLKLDSSINRRVRAENYQDYAQCNINSEHLRKSSPFVWYEAHRQGLL